MARTPNALAARLLRAKAGELEAIAGGMAPAPSAQHLAADIALVAGLLAEHLEAIEALTSGGDP